MKKHYYTKIDFLKTLSEQCKKFEEEHDFPSYVKDHIDRMISYIERDVQDIREGALSNYWRFPDDIRLQIRTKLPKPFLLYEKRSDATNSASYLKLYIKGQGIDLEFEELLWCGMRTEEECEDEDVTFEQAQALGNFIDLFVDNIRR